MKTSYYSILVAVFFLITSGCEDNGETDKKITGTGPIVTKNLNFATFDKIENTGVANFYIIVGNSQSVELKAQQNIIDVMTYEVASQTLKVGLEKNITLENHEEIRFDIMIPSITGIELAGIGDFVLSGTDQDELTINFTGVGNIEAFDLKVDTCYITSSGIGDCEVYVVKLLDVEITGIGKVYYKGSPTITSDITGLGQLIDANP